jgi:glycosyltransferase involved in cell wall biosynthesis
VELVFVDDACPERSMEALPAEPPGGRVAFVRIRHPENRGQQAAVRTGLAAASGVLVAVMDADLQDAPEDLPALVTALRHSAGRFDIVAAGRSGRYESGGRQFTARLFRGVRWLLSGRRIPPDAGLFLVMTGEAAAQIDRTGAPADLHLLTVACQAGLRICTIPLVRHPRPEGRSAYGSRARLSVAVRSLLALTRREIIR